MLMAAPEMLAAAATDVAAVGSTVSAAHMAAVAHTVAMPPAAADEVSASIAQLFSRCAQDYHALAGQAAAFNEQFAQHMNAAAQSYAATEAASAASLQPAYASPGQDLTPIPITLMNYLQSYLSVLVGIYNVISAYPTEITALTMLLVNYTIQALNILGSKIFGL